MAAYCRIPEDLVPSATSGLCDSTTLLLVPFITGHISGIGMQLLLGNSKLRNKIRFRDQNYLVGEPWDHEPWTPWSAIGSSALFVIQSMAYAGAYKNAGLDVRFGALFSFFLTRPRTGWVVITLSTCFSERLTNTATDMLFQECLLGLLALPASVSFMNFVIVQNVPHGCPTNTYYGATSDLKYVGRAYTGVAALGLLACAVVFMGIGVAMIWTGRFLKKRLGWFAMIPSLAAFCFSWLLWIGFAWAVADESFCPREPILGSLAVVSIIFPLISGTARSWIGYPWGGY